MPTNDLELQREVLKKRLSTLIELYDLVDDVRSEASSILNRQYSSTWSAVDPAIQFSEQYRVLLADVTQNLRALQGQIDTFRTALEDTESDYLAHDEDVRALFAKLDERLHPPTPYGPFPPYGPYAPDSPYAPPSGTSTPRPPGNPSR